MTIGQLKKDRTSLDREAQKTYEHLEVISKETHETGSENCHAVKNYIVEVLNNIGCDYHIQSFDINVRTNVEKLIKEDVAYYKAHKEEKKSWDAFAVRQGYSDFLIFIQKNGVEWYAKEHYNKPADYIFSENNILTKFDAAATDDAVLFVAHYDSVGVSYGAGDNGLSCAALLTAVKKLQEKNITNDIYLLFTDGEEKGLFGANHFVEENDELLHNVKLVIDIEGGANGAYQLLRTAGSNSGMITETDRALSNFTYYSALDGAFSYMGLYTD
jgi:acetylornithine deacetylase/succinyl-diaminopimelate desuccinylase-like protein